MKITNFMLFRGADETGVSGTGLVMIGVVWPDGSVVTFWLSDVPSKTIYNSFADMLKIHVIRHPRNDHEIVLQMGNHTMRCDQHALENGQWKRLGPPLWTEGLTQDE